jgi:hypothetical protein
VVKYTYGLQLQLFGLGGHFGNPQLKSEHCISVKSLLGGDGIDRMLKFYLSLFCSVFSFIGVLIFIFLNRRDLFKEKIKLFCVIALSISAIVHLILALLYWFDL